MEKLRVRLSPVPPWIPLRADFQTWNPDVLAGRFEVPVDQGNGWSVTVKVLKKDDRPVVGSILIEPTEWALERQRHDEDPEYTSHEDYAADVPGEGLTRSEVIKMSWESWRERAEEVLEDLSVDDLLSRGINLADIQAIAPRKPGASRRRLTDVEKARVAIQYAIAVARGERTGRAIADYLGVSEKRARNLIGELRHDGFLTETEGNKAGGTFTQKSIDLFKAQVASQRKGKTNG